MRILQTILYYLLSPEFYSILSLMNYLAGSGSIGVDGIGFLPKSTAFDSFWSAMNNFIIELLVIVLFLLFSSLLQNNIGKWFQQNGGIILPVGRRNFSYYNDGNYSVQAEYKPNAVCPQLQHKVEYYTSVIKKFSQEITFPLPADGCNEVSLYFDLTASAAAGDASLFCSPMTRTAHHYCVVICSYGTRYPSARRSCDSLNLVTLAKHRRLGKRDTRIQIFQISSQNLKAGIVQTAFRPIRSSIVL